MNGSFAASLAEFAEQAKEAIDNVFREVIIEIGSSVIRMSPVDTGRFRGNWQFSIDSPAVGSLDRVDINGSRATAELVNGALQFKAGETAYIVNNLPYAIRLEYGWSDQAPGGFVRITLDRFQRIVEEAIRANKI
nr:HK97 gp10 family phage protein [uncultured Pseudomonas sp.]